VHAVAEFARGEVADHGARPTLEPGSSLVHRRSRRSPRVPPPTCTPITSTRRVGARTRAAPSSGAGAATASARRCPRRTWTATSSTSA
jgi:hypothetical protein